MEDEQGWSLVNLPLIEPQESSIQEMDISEAETHGTVSLIPNPLEFLPLYCSVLCEHDRQQQDTFGFSPADWTTCIGLVGFWACLDVCFVLVWIYLNVPR